MMKTPLLRTFLVGLIAIAALSFVSPVAAAVEEIRSFDAVIEVRSDGHVIVRERITYVFPGSRHGIYRVIPESYVDESGKRSTVPIKVLSVTNEVGVPLRATVTTSSRGRSIRIGDPNVFVSGEQVYVITYDVTGAVRYFTDHDELYWNVTGTEWEVPVRAASASVRLPSGIVRTDIRTRCFVGAHGSTSEDCLRATRENGAEFSAKGPLTVVVGWPKGHVAVLKAVVSRRAFSIALALLPLLIPVAVFARLYVVWRRHGRDPAGRGTTVVQYDPPAGTRPADVGFLMDERADVSDITATIVDLAVRGYLRITEIEKKGIFSKGSDFEFTELGGNRSEDQSLTSYERSILNVIFGFAGTSVKMSVLTANHAFHREIDKLQKKIGEEAVRKGYFPEEPAVVRKRYFRYGIISVGVLVPVMFFAVFLGDTGFTSIVAIALTSAAFFAFAPLMARKTAAGVAATEHALGFKEYLARAEKYRLQWQEHEKMFEAFLPYAMVFGVVDKYTKAFAGIGLTPPDSGWYVGPSVMAGRFDVAKFVTTMSSLSSGLTVAVQSAPAPERSSSGSWRSSGGSGFSSGGSSGGGFGGGGGGSW